MHKDKGKGMFIIQIGTPEQGVREERVERKEEKLKKEKREKKPDLTPQRNTVDTVQKR